MQTASGGRRTDFKAPEVLPIFPLTGAILLPRGRLPLNVFEPRYLKMVDDALASHRMIGMVQPSGDGQRPPVYGIGGAGRITSFAETGDGRYLITLTGVSRFRIADELNVITPYRQVRADWQAFAPDQKDGPEICEAERDKLLGVLRDYLSKQNLDADWDSIEDAVSENLINSLSMICPFGREEKQALLEAPSLEDRADSLIAMMRFAIAEQDSDGDAHLQ